MDSVSFNQVVSRGCGLDVHKKVVVATINGEGLKAQTREFTTFMRSLTELKDWLLEKGVTHVAMESAGVYWKPVYQGRQVTMADVESVYHRKLQASKEDLYEACQGCMDEYQVYLLQVIQKESHHRCRTLDTEVCLSYLE